MFWVSRSCIHAFMSRAPGPAERLFPECCMPMSLPPHFRAVAMQKEKFTKVYLLQKSVFDVHGCLIVDVDPIDHHALLSWLE